MTTRRPCRYRHRVSSVPRVKDGDSVEATLDIDVGPLHHHLQSLRILDADAPEVRDVLGPAATDYTTWWVRAHTDLEWLTWKRDNFGRRLGYLVDLATGDDLTTGLLETGNAVRAHLARLVVGAGWEPYVR